MQTQRSEIFHLTSFEICLALLPTAVVGRGRLCRLFLSRRYSHCDAGSRSTVVFQCRSEHQVCLLRRSQGFPSPVAARDSPLHRCFCGLQAVCWGQNNGNVNCSICCCLGAPVDQFCASLFGPVSWFSMEENKLRNR